MTSFTMTHESLTRRCLREPIDAIIQAADCLDQAVTEHLQGNINRAKELIQLANRPAIREWTESIWGPKSTYVQYQIVASAPAFLSKDQRIKVRMPNAVEQQMLLRRDGYHCRFCGIPVIRRETRERFRKVYSDIPIWGRKNTEQHAAFQAMWVQYDHVLPHCRGGSNDLDNIVVTCAPCNYGRMQYTLEEVRLIDPRLNEPVRSNWNGLERFR